MKIQKINKNLLKRKNIYIYIKKQKIYIYMKTTNTYIYINI